MNEKYFDKLVIGCLLSLTIMLLALGVSQIINSTRMVNAHIQKYHKHASN